MRICIVYEMNNREYYNCVLLQRELMKRGHTVVIRNKCEDVNLIKSYDITLVPNSYNSSDVEYYRKVFNVKNNMLIVYPCEQISSDHKALGLFDESDDNPVKKIPHLCWGEDYLEWIKELGYDMQNNIVTGAVLLDYCRPEFKPFYKSRSEIAKEFGLPINKKWILFISDFVLSNDLRFEQFINAGAYTRDVLSKKRAFEEKNCKTIINWFCEFLSKNDDYILIYRKHPVEILTDSIVELTNCYRDKFFLISDLNIKEWLFCSDYVTTWNSTGVIESYAGRIKVGLLRPFAFDEKDGMTEYPFYRGYQAISTYEELSNCLIHGLYDYTPATQKEITRLYSITETPSFIRVADAIEELSKRNIKMPWEKKDSHRLLFLIKKQVLIKSIIKKCYQFFYRLTAGKDNNGTKGLLMINEWKESVNNKKKLGVISGKIDEIISNAYQ